MVWQPTRLTRVQLEERRFAAGRLLRARQLSQAAIARELGASRASVTRWQHRLERAGGRGLGQGPPPGRPAPLAAPQWHQLFRLLRRGAQAAGFETEAGTLRPIAQV